MTFDFSKIKPKKRGDLPVDPVELFQKLKVYDPGINDRCQPRRAVFVNKVVRFNQATNASFCASARTSFGGFNQTFSTLFQFLI